MKISLSFSIYYFSNLQRIANFPGIIKHTKLILDFSAIRNAAKICKLLVLFKNALLRLLFPFCLAFLKYLKISSKYIVFGLGG